MVNKQESKYLRFVSIMTLAVIAFLCLVSMACGAPTTLPQVVKSVDNENLMNTSTQIPTETSTKEMTVCNSGGLNIRLEPSADAKIVGELKDGDSVTVTGTRIVAEDMGLWWKIDSGYVNARFVCEVK